MCYILLPDTPDRRALGGKAGRLAALHGAGFPVPSWFALGPQAFIDSLPPAQREALAAGGEPTDLAAIHPSGAVREALRHALRDLLAEGRACVAVRSSAAEEDGDAQSFAGMLESFLYVPPDEVEACVEAVWRSAFGPGVQAYRQAQGLSGPPTPPAVLIQRMVAAERAGVAFSADPVSGARDVAVVSAVFGAGTALVGGRAEADTYRLDPAGTVVDRHVAVQRTADRLDGRTGRGLQTLVLAPEEGARAVLTDAKAAAVAALARRVEAHFGTPQDIEWAFDAQGRLFLLQARPITRLPEEAAATEAYRLWDNSNIAESYSGVTTPLTFSFARKAYEEVYRSFCRLMGVSEPRLDAHAGTFRTLLGLHGGRLYYNLLSWYETLALLPGFRFNRTFMEEMMGVRERLPAHLLPAPAPATRAERRRDLLHLVRAGVRCVTALFGLPRRTEAFYARLDRVLTLPKDGLDHLSLDELATHYRRLEAALLTRWDAPIVNDFFAMIFFGLARRLLARWVPEGEALLNPLLGGQGGLISAEPAHRIREMAERAQEDPVLIEALTSGSLGEIQPLLDAHPVLREKVAAYLDRFSDRCLHELKLESPTLADDPLVLLRSVGGLARRLRREALPAPGAAEVRARRSAEERLREGLRGRPLRRALLLRVLAQARDRVAGRENLRFERTRVFGTARRLFLEMGRRLHAAGRLAAPHDVFYLEVEEILGFVEGTAVTTDLRGLAAVRRAEFERFQALPAPPDRFATRGAAHLRRIDDAAPADPTAPASGDERAGLGCGPGVVQGRVRVVRDPRSASLTGGEILVAERTDPGWIVLFAACSGLIVERGSLLSHAGIVARELGLPAVVSLPGATSWLRDGDLVLLDGRTGRVRRLQAAPVAAPDPACHEA